MSVHIYMRATKLTDVCGRVDYATNPDRQEHLLATASTVEGKDFWKQLAKDSQAAFREAGGARMLQGKGKKVVAKCCEARELVLDLPNSILTEDIPEAVRNERLQSLARDLADDFKEQTGCECVVGIHLNEAENNLHVHLIFAERELLQVPEIRVADRNIFLDETGRRRRTKKEILDPDGQLRPGCSIIPKGEVVSERHFGSKKPMFDDKGWLYEHKHHMAAWINENLNPDQKREVFDRYGPYLAQRHVGKAKFSKKDEIEAVERRNREWNVYVKEFNALVKDGTLTREDALSFKTEISLSPDQLQELKAVVSHIRCKHLSLDEAERKEAEGYVSQAGKAKRSKVDADAYRKAKLRDAYRRSKLAWQKYRMTENAFEKKVAFAEARAISSEIDRRERDLGYDRPRRTGERKQAVWDASRAAREAAAEDEELRRRREDLQRQRALAYQKLQMKKALYQEVRDLPRGSVARDQALDALQEASQEYRAVRDEQQTMNKAYRLQQEYRSYALELASDPTVSQDDADRALEKYKAAARRLQNPTQANVKEMQRHLKDLRKSQEIRNEKAASWAGNDGFAGGGVGNR